MGFRSARRMQFERGWRDRDQAPGFLSAAQAVDSEGEESTHRAMQERVLGMVLDGRMKIQDMEKALAFLRDLRYNTRNDDMNLNERRADLVVDGDSLDRLGQRTSEEPRAEGNAFVESMLRRRGLTPAQAGLDPERHLRPRQQHKMGNPFREGMLRRRGLSPEQAGFGPETGDGATSTPHLP